jgi:metal-dependent HD superfamily phosphatase/phosphodiesterase
MSMPLNLPIQGNERLRQVVSRIDGSRQLDALWTSSNIVAIDRMRINDHGPVHIKIMTNIALKLMRLLATGGVVSSVVSDHALQDADAEVIVVLASVLHDIGHVIHRDDHETFSLVLAAPMIDELIADVYDARTGTIIKGETLHAIYAHRRDVAPLTIEAGVVKVADALDMEAGRARIPFSTGEPTIHSVSAMAIQKVRLGRGHARPIRISIEMSNSAGIFQLDNLLREKLKNSTIAPYVEVVAEIAGDEEKLIERYSIE